MHSDEARARFAESPVARLATVGADGLPHLVPVCFAVLGERIVTAVDHKPKRTGRLRRLSNITANPAVCLLVDAYDPVDWTALWWARADGTARVADPGAPESAEAIAALVERYPQYRARRPDGPVIVIAVSRWSGWSAAGDSTLHPPRR
jgi:PPOX class probable F420-dependent enzyme